MMKNKNANWVLGNLITPHESSGNYDIVLGISPAGSMGPPPHKHNALNEFFLITKGEMEFVIDNTIQVVKAGESVNLPAGAIHTFRNPSKQEAQWLNIHSPRGFLEFFERIGIDANQENAQTDSMNQEIIDEVFSLAAKYDMEFI